MTALGWIKRELGAWTSDKVYCGWRGSGSPRVNLDKWDVRGKTIDRGSKNIWLCFVQRSTANLSGVLPEEGNVLLYTLPSRAVSPDPTETRDILRRMRGAAIEDIRDRRLRNKQINLMGISLPITVAYSLCNKEGIRPNRIVAVGAGIDIGYCVQNSIATYAVSRTVEGDHRKKAKMLFDGAGEEEATYLRDINEGPQLLLPLYARELAAETTRLGWIYGAALKERTADLYQDALSEFDPRNTISSLTQDTRVDIYYGGRDRMTPDGKTVEFVQAHRDHGIEPKVILDKKRGHVQTICNFARQEWWRDSNA